MTTAKKKVHFWVAPRLAGDADLVSDRSACGQDMYPNTGDRPGYSEVPGEVTCKRCATTKWLGNLEWFDAFSAGTVSL